MIIARVFEFDRPGVRVRAGRPLFGGPFGRVANITVSGTRDTWWSRLFGERVEKVWIRDRGFEVCLGNEEVTHALVYLDLAVDFVFCCQPQLSPECARYVLWQEGTARLMLLPEGEGFSVSVTGIWVPSPIGLSFFDAPIVCDRTFSYVVGRGGIVYQDRVI